MKLWSGHVPVVLRVFFDLWQKECHCLRQLFFLIGGTGEFTLCSTILGVTSTTAAMYPCPEALLRILWTTKKTQDRQRLRRPSLCRCFVCICVVCWLFASDHAHAPYCSPKSASMLYSSEDGNCNCDIELIRKTWPVCNCRMKLILNMENDCLFCCRENSEPCPRGYVLPWTRLVKWSITCDTDVVWNYEEAMEGPNRLANMITFLLNFFSHHRPWRRSWANTRVYQQSRVPPVDSRSTTNGVAGGLQRKQFPVSPSPMFTPTDYTDERRDGLTSHPCEVSSWLASQQELGLEHIHTAPRNHAMTHAMQPPPEGLHGLRKTNPAARQGNQRTRASHDHPSILLVCRQVPSGRHQRGGRVWRRSVREDPACQLQPLGFKTCRRKPQESWCKPIRHVSALDSCALDFKTLPPDVTFTAKATSGRGPHAAPGTPLAPGTDELQKILEDLVNISYRAAAMQAHCCGRLRRLRHCVHCRSPPAPVPLCPEGCPGYDQPRKWR